MSLTGLETAFTKLAGSMSQTSNQKGLFGRVIEVKVGNTKITSEDDYDIDFDIPFDDDTEVNTSTIVFYNLAKTTLANIKKGAKITVKAGYKRDSVGQILNGKITKVVTQWSDLDQITTVTAEDSNGVDEKDLQNFSYSKGTTAQTILKDLIKYLGLPIKTWKPKSNYKFAQDVSVSGSLSDAIKKYAEVCESLVYVCKSEVYVVGYGATASKEYFDVKAATGLLEVSTFTEDDPTYTVKSSDKAATSSSSTKVRKVTSAKSSSVPQVEGVNIKMLLQHKIYTGAVIKLTSKIVSGSYRVASGTHSADDDDFITTVKAYKI